VVGLREEVVVPFPVERSQVRAPTKVRSTLLAASFQSIRSRGHEQVYLRNLPEEYHPAIESLIAGVWQPFDFAAAHYRALDAIPFTMQERLELGADVSRRIQESILAIAARAARGAGVTPWTGFPLIHRLWDRLFDGGAIQVTKVGPKEARVEVIQCPLLGIPHFRVAFRGFIMAGVELFARKVYASEVGKLGAPSAVIWRYAWA